MAPDPPKDQRKRESESERSREMVAGAAVLVSSCPRLLLRRPCSASPRRRKTSNPAPPPTTSTIPHLRSSLECFSTNSWCIRSTKWSSQELWGDPDHRYGSKFDDDHEDDEDEDEVDTASSIETAASEYDELVTGQHVCTLPVCLISSLSFQARFQIIGKGKRRPLELYSLMFCWHYNSHTNSNLSSDLSIQLPQP